MNTEVTSTASQDSKNIALLTWVGTIFFSFVPSLIVYLVKTDDTYIQSQSKEALNWAITAMIGYAISFVLSFVLIGFLGFMILGLCNLVFCILGAIATSNGKDFKVPFALRLIK